MTDGGASFARNRFGTVICDVSGVLDVVISRLVPALVVSEAAALEHNARQSSNTLKLNSADVYLSSIATCLEIRENILQSETFSDFTLICTRSVQKTRELFELRGLSLFQENPLGVARFVQNS